MLKEIFLLGKKLLFQQAGWGQFSVMADKKQVKKQHFLQKFLS